MAEDRQTMFEDVPDTHWARAIIEKAVEKGLIAGEDTGRFEPQKVVGKAEFESLVYACISLPEGTLGSDSRTDAGGRILHHSAPVGSNYSKNELALIPLTPPTQDAPLTRQQMAAIIYDVIVYKGIMMTMQYVDLSAIFSDYGDVGDGFHNAFQAVYKLGIITGTAGDTLSPTAEVTKAQAAAVLLRTYTLLEDMGIN